MLKRIAAALLVMLCIMGSAFAEKTMYVNNPNPNERLNLRRYPERDSLSHGKYYNGAEVTVLKTEGQWSQVTIQAAEKRHVFERKHGVFQRPEQERMLALLF